MRFKLIHLSVLACALTLAHSSAVLACCHGGHKGDWVVKVVEKLHLNAEQKAKVNLYAHKAKIELAVKRHEMHVLCKQINEAFHSGTINSAKLDALADKETHLVGTIIRLKLQERFDIYQVLDAKQKAQMDMLIAKWESEHHEKHHKHHHDHHE